MGIRERIKQYIENKGISKYKFYQKIEVANGFLDKEGNIGSDKCEKIIYQYPDINIEWLITGKGSMFKNNSNMPPHCILENKDACSHAMMNPPLEPAALIPLVKMNAINHFGEPNFFLDEQCIKDYYVVPKFSELKLKIDFLIEITDTSMYPQYNSGNIVACSVIRDSQFIQWNKVYIIATTKQGILIKRLKKDTDSRKVIAISDNKRYAPFEIPFTEITGIALVVGMIRLQ